MGNASFNQDWYGMQAKVLAQSDDRVVVDYGCKGRGIVKNYNLFEGIQLCFLDFESDESMETQKFNPDIIQITHCQTGRYECEFANHTVSYLPEGYFSVAATEHLPYQVMLDRYQQTIRELHIEKLKDRNLFDLSGGQKQTIAFASVYALNPDIFVLDEPSSNLDPEAIQELRRLLLLIKAQGKTIVVSEHRLYFLNGIADRIVLMEHGKLKQSWSASDFALFNAEQIKALGLRSYTPTRLELPDTMPSRNEPPAVEVKDLAIGYEKGEPVAQHLNFRVYPGEIVGVVGKNGCGKSTLARTLCGLQKELRGEVLYKNSMVPSKRRIRKAYLVMQDPDYQLFTDSVYQELLLALSDQKDKDEKRIDDILDELNLTIYKERHPMSLSGGQKQRTAIGVAALRDAEVLIFDEPTSGLDYKNMESVAEILSALSKRGKAILVISHDNELLMKICSRVIRVDERTSS